ncbi:MULTISPECIES: 2-amino-4-hydroxy-6-hydroxymethyldihydropteridine diphosphokinase [Sphingobacterium]|uniref:2-amino-4-hydroxy-6-hydroxymethyldihydropteridine pyrophosphokinase n=1 Tax=Sphingobacterium cellulitidis TaxID=1768011 RepID=A0A8H9G690_9SPHI|nr:MULTISPECIES: 2-amino-4-hydroxy-6-hydroxymethyldihydropteridine diphosphokinase [Sphingobacterium]MBA8988696.1 2-amino-4-hydroxy-6-hydroxymethyldihydropteridine diphosphokinase [Sphingobacterium soli]OYD43250.1 2-amino-4-hydroxy-6-hydroxymethyldihydropteridine diphosphokinase [Sphingobacterium cellulitidis]WFB62645.1 2-amino-4-hydroxy-6-hydroxymethyldihydropteridine diphosphokinase [Sphingobacterium sp. WM]GGE35432.1 2-amino-4-hydroxy-6-hydroxymethyldihydropteridine diphosphokinase [Sphingob
MNIVYLLLGANIGNPNKQLDDAKIEIEDRIGKITSSSSIYESEAWGVENQPVFLNQVIQVETELSANKVLNDILKIELLLGRIRGQRWGSRIIDIDILYYNSDIIHTDELQVPHPYIQERNFTLIPLVEIAADYIHPIFKKSNKELLEESTDILKVKTT